MNTKDEIIPEFSRVFDLGGVDDSPRSIDLTAQEEELRLLAMRFDQHSIGRLEANLIITWSEPGKVFSVSGRFVADVVQTCVVSLEPMEVSLNEDINLVFAYDIDDLEDLVVLEDAEPFDGETIDLGELVAEELYLALDPYPRREDIETADIDLGPGALFLSEEEARKSVKKPSPFEIFAPLKPKT
ncbi:MAG: DUF177 domain-containing protein [Pseudomonadota bacterium]|nr:DUF177 domain-containing protein [Pseudomonadota bacterium]